MLGYKSQMSLMGFVDAVTQDFVLPPIQKVPKILTLTLIDSNPNANPNGVLEAFPGRGVSVDDHDNLYKLIRSGWEEANEELMVEWLAKKKEKARLQEEKDLLKGAGLGDSSDDDLEGFGPPSGGASKRGSMSSSPSKRGSKHASPALRP